MCQYCGYVEWSLLPLIGFLPIFVRDAWRWIRRRMMIDPYVIHDYYHDRTLPEWYCTYAEAEAAAQFARGETGRKTFEIIRLKRAK
jgi:hypothetical protein